MALYHYFNNAFRYVGAAVEILPTATVTLYDNQTSNALTETIYGDAAGLTTKTNPFAANASGDIEFWLGSAKFVRVRIDGGGGSGGAGVIDMDFQPVLPDPAQIVTRAIQNAIYVNDPIYSNGVDIAAGVVEANSAFTNAFNDALSMSTPTSAFGALVLVKPGIYRVRNLQIPSGVVVVGAGDSTMFFRRNYNDSGDPVANSILHTIGLYGSISNGLGTNTNNGIANCLIHGNYTNNNHDVYGSTATELYTNSNDYLVQNVGILQYNANALNLSGKRGKLSNIRVFGISAATYKPDNNALGNYKQDFGSFQGIVNTGFDVCLDCTLINAYVEGTRLAGFAAGGENLTVRNLTVSQCHRGDSNVISGTVTAGSAVGYATTVGPTQGGSQLTLVKTKPSAGGATSTQDPTYVVMSNVHIKPTLGAVAGGAEIHNGIDIKFDNFNIETQNKHGIFVVDTYRLQLSNSTIKSSVTTGLFLGSGVVGVKLTAVDFIANALGLHITSTANFIQSIGCKWQDNTTNYSTSGGTGTLIDHILPQTVNGTTVQASMTAPILGPVTMSNGLLSISRDAAAAEPALLVHNINATGAGAYIKAGTTSGHSPLAVYDKDGNTLFFVTAGTLNITAFNTRSTSASVRAMTGYYENNAIKYYFGLDADDNPAIIAADGTTVLMSFNRTTGIIAGTGSSYSNSFTPQIAQPTTSIALASSYAEYNVIGKEVHLRIGMGLNAAGTSATIKIMNIPAAIAPSRTGVAEDIGGFTLLKSGVGFYSGRVIAVGANDFKLLLSDGAFVGDYFGVGVILAANDVITLNLKYKTV